MISVNESSWIAFVQRKHLSRGAKEAEKLKRLKVEKKREQIAELVIARHKLSTAHNNVHIVRHLAGAGKEGALDSGVRTLGGVFLAKGTARAVPKLGNSIAAPLAIASILVDIGKEYNDYRQKYTERKQRGLLSNTSERLLMREFRLRTGLHVVSGTAATAGAGIGAYGMVSSIAFYTGMGILAPLAQSLQQALLSLEECLGTLLDRKHIHATQVDTLTIIKPQKKRLINRNWEPA